jgi:site-specific DNA-methyltransferase (adenine-specific)
MNYLYLGDNLPILRDHVKDESIDLVYLDPPFNSKRDYRLLSASSRNPRTKAPGAAFKDTWHWSDQAEAEFGDLLKHPNTDAAQLLGAFRRLLRQSDMMAYLTFMTSRLLELHRVLRATGSLYLHCDPSASHYLKVMLDAVFGKTGFQSEIVWRRTGAHNKAERWAPVHDTILFYTKSDSYTWNQPRRPYMAGHVRQHFADDGKTGYKTRYYGNVLTGSGKRLGESGAPWMGVDPTSKDRHWAIPGKIWDEVDADPTGLTQHQKLDLLFARGFITIEPGAAWPIYERAVDPEQGPATSDLWAFQPYTEGTVWGTREGIDADVSWLKPGDAERLGYPTQKPLALLHRIILASSHEDEVVLDPFCGCGTTLHASEALHRRWIGIDCAEAAIAITSKRLEDAFGPDCEFRCAPTESAP